MTLALCSSAALENFYRVSAKAKQLVENCCRDDWCQESAFQIQNEEAFKEILLETSLCYNTICKLVNDINGDRIFWYEDLRESSTFDPSSADEVFKDRVALQDIRIIDKALESISASHIRSQHLGKYLLGRVNSALQHSNGKHFDVRSFNLWSDGKGPDEEWSEKSDFLGGNVCKTSWLDVPCAKKFFNYEMQEDEWLAEAKILASLNHSNIVKFLCCNNYETEHTRGHFIAMEQMDTSLGSFIRKLKEGGAKLSLFLALDIILQIAYGMCYLHEIGIAHRDLKTSNVVVRKILAPQLEYYLQAKIVDFGISKVKLQDKSNTMTRPKIGTTIYMPPEAFSKGRANWFKADVYSFSVMCSVILSGAEPFQDIKRNALREAICSGKRPMLPGDIPKELVLLIKEGGAADRNLRPSFFHVCARLEKLRHWLLRDRTLGLSFKQEEDTYSGLHIEKMLRTRSKAREHARLQISMESTEEEEWFDVEENIPEMSPLPRNKKADDTFLKHMPAAGYDYPKRVQLDQDYRYADSLNWQDEENMRRKRWQEERRSAEAEEFRMKQAEEYNQRNQADVEELRRLQARAEEAERIRNEEAGAELRRMKRLVLEAGTKRMAEEEVNRRQGIEDIRWRQAEEKDRMRRLNGDEERKRQAEVDERNKKPELEAQAKKMAEEEEARRKKAYEIIQKGTQDNKVYTKLQSSSKFEICIVCQKEKNRIYRCSRCKSVIYCSRECQVQHWNEEHKYDCCTLESSSSPGSSKGGPWKFSDVLSPRSSRSDEIVAPLLSPALLPAPSPAPSPAPFPAPSPALMYNNAAISHSAPVSPQPGSLLKTSSAVSADGRRLKPKS